MDSATLRTSGPMSARCYDGKRTMKVFERFRAALRAKSPKAADLLTHVREARTALQDAQFNRDQLRARRAEMLTASDAERTGYKAELAAAEDAAEDAALFVQELEARHGKAEALEAEAARKVRYDAAKVKLDAAAKDFERDYTEIGRLAAGLAHLVAEVNEVVDAANDALPSGSSSLARLETLVRDRPAVPREILSDEVVLRWCFVREGRAGPFAQVPVDLSADVSRIQKTGERTGTLPPPPGAYPRTGTPVELRPYRRLEILPEIADRTGPRLKDLEIPGLRAGDKPFLELRGFGSATARETQASLDAIASGANKAVPPQRKSVVEWSAIETEAAGERN